MTRNGMRSRPGLRRYSLGMMLTGWAAIGLAVLLVGGTLYGYAKYRNVLDGIKTETIQGPGHAAAQAEQRAEHPRDRLRQPVRKERQDRRPRPSASALTP